MFNVTSCFSPFQVVLALPPGLHAGRRHLGQVRRAVRGPPGGPGHGGPAVGGDGGPVEALLPHPQALPGQGRLPHRPPPRHIRGPVLGASEGAVQEVTDRENWVVLLRFRYFLFFGAAVVPLAPVFTLVVFVVFVVAAAATAVVVAVAAFSVSVSP